ncbi:MAG: MFS transporter, partial [Solobacterium sp.]|nr:MFS transporter [Solobacterium sp.]
MKHNLNIMLAVSFLQGMVFYASVATLYRLHAGITLSQITLIESVSFVVTLAFELPWGITAERIGYRRTMILCSFLYFLSKVIFWQAAGFGLFLAERIVLGIALAGLSGVDSSVVYLSAGQEQSEKAFGIWGACGTAGMLAASGVSLLLGERYRLMALLTAGAYGLAALLACTLKEMPQAEGKALSSGQMIQIFHRAAGNRKLLAAAVLAGLHAEVIRLLTVVLNQPVLLAAGMSVNLIKMLYIMAAAAGAGGVLSWRFSRFLGRRWAGTFILGAEVLCCVLLGFVSRPVSAGLCILILALGESLMIPLLTAV